MKKKRPLQTGDFFPIPSKIGDRYGFYLARVMHESLSFTIEVFDTFETNFSMTEAEISARTFDAASRLHSPLMAVFLFEDNLLPTAWPILAADPHYDETTSDYASVIFLSPEYRSLGDYFKADKTYRDSSRSLIAEDATVWQPHQLVFRTWYYANKLRPRGSVYSRIETDRELLAAGQYDNKVKEAIEISETVARLFVESGKR
jgi:hypothetical protein